METTSSAMTPQPGLEMLDLIHGVGPPVVVTDLSANVLMAYLPPEFSAADEMRGSRGF